MGEWINVDTQWREVEKSNQRYWNEVMREMIIKQMEKQNGTQTI
jgi:hypothetical protein